MAKAKELTVETKLNKMKFTPEMGTDELTKQLDTHIEQLAEKRVMLIAGQLKETHLINQLKRNIARIKQALCIAEQTV